mmetsp:Transcript_13710/g.24592  ORF Transcript_13710/g.24592 Transcript_13710/m.24592 type:complete len:510 (-) Transcript_13710:259-1788(-)|eukprot:CAMPEP_0182442688 /NCGR_PEP_ID=MMETSP1172-20130603/1595_1 /TAXON_ID=708627 /ORGANISM="Timspurckia oligopyrenoides, Strain CCMP3278" /LENGTH=509 /DNA_ID=CAMNT_0024637699 /DNA_START=142 /DNA_END=1671 /DNA_ORIENTATION=+
MSPPAAFVDPLLLPVSDQMPDAKTFWPTCGRCLTPKEIVITKPLLRAVLGDPFTGTRAALWSSTYHQPLSAVLSNNFESTEIALDPKSGLAHQWCETQAESVEELELHVHIVDSNGCFIGHASIIARELNDLNGVLYLPLKDFDDSVVGTFVCRYTIILPFQNTFKCNGSKVIPKLVGHRGCGAGNRQVRENTIASFQLATQVGSGVNFVELDVHLTADGVPVVYHDYKVGHGSRAVSINACTYDQVLEAFHEMVSENCDSFVHEYSTNAADTLPTLKQVLRELDPSVGILVEIKYPPDLVKWTQKLVIPERNQLVDIVLATVCESEERCISFLSFDADVCSMLRVKQASWPVYLLNSEMRESYNDTEDPRTTTVSGAVSYAQNENLSGLVFRADLVLENEELVRTCHDKGLAVFTYGQDNNDVQQVDRQVACGVDCFITDSLPLLSAHFGLKEAEHLSVLQKVDSLAEQLLLLAEQVAVNQTTIPEYPDLSYPEELYSRNQILHRGLA